MAVTTGDLQSIGTLGWWVTEGAGAAPNAPTLAVVNDGDGDAVTATVDGDAAATNRLYYKKASASTWTGGESRSGDGEIAQAGLDDNTWYEFVCVSSSGGYNSVPSGCVIVHVTSVSSSGTGFMGLAIDNLQTLVATSATFQSWVGATGSAAEKLAAAKSRTYRVARETTTRPFAVVSYNVPAAWEAGSYAGGSKGHYVDSGELLVIFEEDIASANQADDVEDVAELTFMNTVDAIVDEMLAIAGSGAYLLVRDISVMHGPVRSSREEKHSTGEYYQVAYLVRYGLEGAG